MWLENDLVYSFKSEPHISLTKTPVFQIFFFHNNKWQIVVYLVDTFAKSVHLICPFNVKESLTRCQKVADFFKETHAMKNMF